MDELLAPVLAHLDGRDPGGIVGVYLYGSAVSTGLRPDSDVDVLTITRRSLDQAERMRLVALLLGISGWSGHVDRFPDVAGRRPLEMTSLVLEDIAPLTLHPGCDFQYGEWLREDLLAGAIPVPAEDPDVVIMLSTALQSSRPLRGHSLSEVIAPVPPLLLRRAIVEQIPRVISEVDHDARNVLLTLARMLITVETGGILSKDAAAQTVAERLVGDQRALMQMARSGYLGLISDDWQGWKLQALTLSEILANEILTANAAA